MQRLIDRPTLNCEGASVGPFLLEHIHSHSHNQRSAQKNKKTLNFRGTTHIISEERTTFRRPSDHCSALRRALTPDAENFRLSYVYSQPHRTHSHRYARNKQSTTSTNISSAVTKHSTAVVTTPAFNSSFYSPSSADHLGISYRV